MDEAREGKSELVNENSGFDWGSAIPGARLSAQHRKLKLWRSWELRCQRVNGNGTGPGLRAISLTASFPTRSLKPQARRLWRRLEKVRICATKGKPSPHSSKPKRDPAPDGALLPSLDWTTRLNIYVFRVTRNKALLLFLLSRKKERKVVYK